MRHKKGNKINGWLIVDKPEGMGSTQVVNYTRRLFNAQKNGHAGTLDPFATGVLPIAFGEATKLLDFVTDGSKEYDFRLCFGEATDTGDCTGKVINTCDRIPGKDEIDEIIKSFTGEIKQVPPQYSAIKINGQRAYDLARQGKDFVIAPRSVNIYELKCHNTEANYADFSLKCSKGTYVRSLGQDIALKLNSCGHLTKLRRTKCAIFSLQDTILLDNLKNMVYSTTDLLPLETFLRGIAVMAVSEAEASKLMLGQALSPKGRENDFPLFSKAAAVCNGVLRAIVRIDERRISPIRVFNLT